LPNLDSTHAVIIGNGNVSIDCARILLSDHERFRYTDIPDYAYKALASSKIKTVHILGRRGPIEVLSCDFILIVFVNLGVIYN
jgi:hypothetical protein